MLLLTSWYRDVNEFQKLTKMIEMSFSKVNCKLLFCMTILNVCNNFGKAYLCYLFKKQILWLEM